MRVDPLGRSEPVVDKDGRASNKLNLFSENVVQMLTRVGIGSPESIVVAPQGAMYMDQEGDTGEILYIKQLSDIGGDQSEGWVAIG